MLLTTPCAAATPPSFAAGVNNVAGSMPNPQGNPPSIILVGVHQSAHECQGAAKAEKHATSWTYHHCNFPPAGSGNYSCHCYARTDSVWHPKKQALVDSGCIRISPPPQPPPPPPPPPFKCNSGYDCQLNGKCNTTSQRCECDAAWTGDMCEQLNLLPAKPDAGLQDQLYVHVQQSTAPHSTAPHRTAQRSAAQLFAAQHSSSQVSTCDGVSSFPSSY